MCGRYALYASGADVAQKFALDAPPNLPARYNIAPTQSAPVILAGNTLAQAQWGWHTPRGLLINARSESAAVKPSFRRSWRQGRCLVPANLFYEWQRETAKHSLPFAAAVKGQTLFGMAGLVEEREQGKAFVVLTCEAQASVRPIHPRQPLIVPPDFYRSWLEGDSFGEGEILHCWRVSRAVNSVRHDAPDLIAPSKEQQTSAQQNLF